ncbi:MAG: hypothetical protein HY360_21965 [Verrucomicrobia bacterium]|nr:hypothetical protein [Verrucomicrobiota bacterium]
MILQFIERLTREAAVRGLDFLLIGSHAVNAYGYLRTTFDVDLLIADNQRPAWKTLLAHLGYTVRHEVDAFAQFNAPSKEDFDLDLMVVDETTYAKLRANSARKTLGATELSVPPPLHLIALKLHALRTEHRVRRGTDYQDVLAIIRQMDINTQSREFQQILDRYATASIRNQLLRDVTGDRQ